MIGPNVLKESANFHSQLNAFEWAPECASRISGLGGNLPAPDAAYTFQTAPLQAPPGRLVFTLTFEGLQASKGALLIEISCEQGAERRQLKLRTVGLADLAGRGVERIALTSDRAETYTVAGYIYDETDASALSLSIKIAAEGSSGADGSQGASGAMARVARLAGLEPPSFAHPTSQTWSNEQTTEVAFHAACRALGMDNSSWSAAYVYHAVRYLVGDLSGSQGFGAGVSAGIIAGAFEAERAQVVGHPGLDPQFWPPANDLDFAWLIFEEPLIPAGHLFWMINLLLERLAPGGALVIVFTLEHGRMPHEPCAVLKRGDVEAFALRLLARGHSVAQLKFRAGLRQLPVGTRTPFGLMVRRGA